MIASCIGNTFTLKILSLVHQTSPLVIANILWNAVEENIIVPLNQECRLAKDQKNDFSDQDSDFGALYKFQHDRIQQAANALVDEGNRVEMHWKIGQSMLESFSPEEQKEQVIEIVRQLNAGVELLKSKEEKYHLARLNLAAGYKAKAATAYHSAYNYFKNRTFFIR